MAAFLNFAMSILHDRNGRRVSAIAVGSRDGSKPMKTIGAIDRAQGASGRRAVTWLAAAALGVLLAQAATAQEARPPAQIPPAQVQEEKPGFFQSISRWFERGFANFKSGIGDAKSNIDNIGDKAATAGKNIGGQAADATKGAVDAMMKLPSARMVSGREKCDVSPNGAPDCRMAATSICQAKGFAGGQSVDFVSAEKCPAAVWMNRRQPEPGECVTETFVTRAVCQ
jgi:hypothetical protein